MRSRFYREYWPSVITPYFWGMDLTNGRDSAAIRLAEVLVADIINDAILIYTGNMHETAPKQKKSSRGYTKKWRYSGALEWLGMSSDWAVEPQSRIREAGCGWYFVVVVNFSTFEPLDIPTDDKLLSSQELENNNPSGIHQMSNGPITSNDEVSVEQGNCHYRVRARDSGAGFKTTTLKM